MTAPRLWQGPQNRDDHRPPDEDGRQPPEEHLPSGQAPRGQLPVDRDRGTVLVLVVGLAAILVLTISVVVTASRAFLVRRSLASWADGAAVAAAQGVDLAAVYGGRLDRFVPLSQAEASRTVRDYVARHSLSERFDAFRVASVHVSGDGTYVAVTLTAAAPVPFVNAATARTNGWAPISATASARGPLS